MKVLHIYPPKSPSIVQYVSMLVGNDEALQTDDPKALRQLCTEQHPVIVHQHGCLNEDITNACLWARLQGIRIVLTPHGQLQPWEIDGAKTTKSLYLRKLQQLVSHAYTIIARSPMEAENLRKLNWNTRIETVANPIITRTTTTDNLVNSHQIIYRQVMDSNVLELMDTNTRNALRTLIKAAITQDERWVKPFESSSVNWHHLLIYAHQEGIASYVQQGLFVLRINIPAIESSPIYLPTLYKKPKPMGTIPLVDIINNIYELFQQHQLSLLPLVELNQALRRDDVEDDILMQQLSAEKLDVFLQAILPVVQEQTGLDEGFMPCQPTENSITRQIREQIAKHLEI